MFNEWDRRCAAVQLMLSTDPSYDNRTIASTLKIRTCRRPTSPKRPRFGFRRSLRLCTLLSMAPSTPTWTHWTTSFGHTSRTSPTWPPTTPKPAWLPPSAEYSLSIRRAPASACGKGMLPVPDPYRDGDWGWRWLYWIDVSSTNLSSSLNWYFQ